MRKAFLLLVGVLAFCSLSENAAEKEWKTLPLVKNGKIDPSWVQIGFGGFAVEGDMLRTDPAAEGIGLLTYTKEKFGNCQLRVVFKPKEARSNSGFYVRVDDGILDQMKKPGEKFVRDASGKISDESMRKAQAAAERDEGPWYAVHHGYEIQIAGDTTGSVYSLAPSEVKSKVGGEWRTMVITLNGTKINVELDGQHASSVDTSRTDLPERKIWHQPKREPKRPEKGYIGLQTHDPEDIVWFKEVSVRPLPKSTK